MSAVVVVDGVSKQYGALRPLRIEHLEIAAGEQVAILGLDQPAAEVFINLVTGASVPDTGSITVFGRPTTAISDSTEWLAVLDRFGIVSDRAPLLDSLSVVQNLAVPFSLEIEPPPPDIRAQAIKLAVEAKLVQDLWERPAVELDPASRIRLRVARALALDPGVLLLEHPTATLAKGQVVSVAREIREISETRRLTNVALTTDREFAGAIASRALTLEPATGRLKPLRLGRISFWS